MHLQSSVIFCLLSGPRPRFDVLDEISNVFFMVNKLFMFANVLMSMDSCRMGRNILWKLMEETQMDLSYALASATKETL